MKPWHASSPTTNQKGRHQLVLARTHLKSLAPLNEVIPRRNNKWAIVCTHTHTHTHRQNIYLPSSCSVRFATIGYSNWESPNVVRYHSVCHINTIGILSSKLTRVGPGTGSLKLIWVWLVCDIHVLQATCTCTKVLNDTFMHSDMHLLMQTPAANNDKT